ncbi:hypothetical protein GOV09_00035 [Candidatus Woesearchaeota archaeon]|nr:hypothetical protein [Candidatus Woesearchaeota archaeon]
MDINSVYTDLQKELKLPSFEKFNAEFEISGIDEGYVPRKIAERIVERVEKYRKFLEEFLHADGMSLAILSEIKIMDDKDKDTMNALYKEMIVLEREFQICELLNEGFRKFVQEGYKKWTSLKKGLLRILEKAKDSWKNVDKIKEDLGYMG